MAVTAGAALLGSALVGGASSIIGGGKAADAAEKGTAAGIAEQRRQFDTILGLTAPQRDVGNQALNTLASAFVPGYQGMDVGGGNEDAFNQAYQQWRATQPDDRKGFRPIPGGRGAAYGVGGGGNSLAQFQQLVDSGQIKIPGGKRLAPIGADALSQQFRNLPGTQFMLNEQNRNIGNSFAARGGALSGNALRALADRTSAFASDRIFGQLNTLAGFGNSATNTASGAASATGANVSNLLAQQGSDRASGILAQYGGVANAAQGGLNNYALLDMLKKGGG
jgi:hypothetical protein